MIIADGISKSFKGKKVIDSLSFHISKGEIVGFIGANGAGKTTTIRMLSGGLLQDSGLIMVNGINPTIRKNENLKNIGLVSNINSSLWKDMKLKDSFELGKYLYKMSNSEFNKKMSYLREKLDLDKILEIPVCNLSLGQRMRSEVAYSILHNPKVLYLDEATIGLDIENKEKVLNIIKEINNERQTTILLASNNLADIEKVCSKVIVIDKGKIMYEGSISRLIKKYASEYLMKIIIEGDKIPDFQDLPINKYKINNNKICISYNNNFINSAVIIKHIITQCFIKDIQIIEPKLEDVISKMYER